MDVDVVTVMRMGLSEVRTRVSVGAGPKASRWRHIFIQKKSGFIPRVEELVINSTPGRNSGLTSNGKRAEVYPG